MNRIVGFNLCTLSDKELAQKVDERTDALYVRGANRDNLLAAHIPARPNEDYDLLVGELIKRFLEKRNQ